MSSTAVASTSAGVALCLCVKNDAFRIKEWVAYHLSLGADRLVIYDNLSDDGTREILDEAAAADARVVGETWPRTDWLYQSEAYRDMVERFGADYTWMGFIDSDEFVVLHEHPDLRSFLAEYPTRLRSS